MSLAYDRTGHGESLVLIHGLGHRRQGWDAVVPLLATDRDVIAVDAALPGFRHCPHPAPAAAGVPTTIAWGRRDLLLFPHQARRARRALPGARFVALPGCGHAPMADDPELVVKVLLEASRPA